MGKPSMIQLRCFFYKGFHGDMMAFFTGLRPKKLCKKPERRRGILYIYIAGGAWWLGSLLDPSVGSFCKLGACWDL